MASVSSSSILVVTSTTPHLQFISRGICAPSTSRGISILPNCGSFSEKYLKPIKVSRTKHIDNTTRLKPLASIENEKSSSSASVQTSELENAETEIESLVETISFGQLCDEFECISSPAVERTARQLARDILNVKENSRLLSCFAMAVKYKDPLRSFTGRDKYKRVSWILTVLEKPSVSVLKMEMKSSSELIIKWKVKGKIKIPPASLLGQELCLVVTSAFKLNQISGQVIEHVDEWDLSNSSPPSFVFFWSSRTAWALTELTIDAKEGIKTMSEKLGSGNQAGDIYSDPTDPKRFFQQSNPNSELYQVGFFIALVYLLVQTLRVLL